MSNGNQKVLETASEVLRILEGTRRRKGYWLIALAGAAATSLMWWFHFTDGLVPVSQAFQGGSINATYMLIMLVPPFALVFGLGHALFHGPATQEPSDGPMSSYFQQQDSYRNWKIMVSATSAAAANLLLLMATAG